MSNFTTPAEWTGPGERVDGTVCDWVYNSSQGSVTSPDHWLPKDTLCTYTLHVFPGNALHLVLTVYGLRSDTSWFTLCEWAVKILQLPEFYQSLTKYEN